MVLIFGAFTEDLALLNAQCDLAKTGQENLASIALMTAQSLR
jgi:hypothetical protein